MEQQKMTRGSGLDRNTWLESLVAAAAEGKDEAWRSMMTAFTPMLRGMARQYRLSEADVDEAVQATWVRCFEHLEQLREPATLPGWLLTTCRRECIAIYHKQGRTVLVGEEMLAIVDAASSQSDVRHSDPASILVFAELIQTLRHLIDQLPQRQRAVLNELEAAEHSYQAVSQRLGLPIGSIGPTRQRAIRRLQAGFEQAVA